MRSLQLLFRCLYKVLPLTKRHLDELRARAEQIPDPELRKQALLSLEKKQFHSDGGAVYAAFTKHPNRNLTEAIVAFQTISDYLDNLCDRSTSLDAKDFIRLHQAMIDAITLDEMKRERNYYYEYHQEKEDGGYLTELVEMTRRNLACFPAYHEVAELVRCLTQLYCELQVHKHVRVQERVPRLQAWFDDIASDPDIQNLLGIDLRKEDIYWWEFAAASGSTLGIFSLWTAAADSTTAQVDRNLVGRKYFPWITGLHILLDYWIDQEEDRLYGDLNFFTYYQSVDHAYERLSGFIQRAREHSRQCPSAEFHSLVVEGLVGMYLSDRKVSRQPGHERVHQLVKESGWVTRLFYRASHYYRKRTRHA